MNRIILKILLIPSDTPPGTLLRNCVFAIAIAVALAASAPRASAVEIGQLEVTVAQASRSSSGARIDKRLNFAKTGLLRTAYNVFTYIGRYPLRLAEGKTRRLSIGGKISVVIGFKGFVGPGRKRVQYYLETYSGKKRQARIYYSVSRGGAPAITGIDQPGGRGAYVVIIRAPK
ncbi:hypothetical protein HQ563_12550 [bacterium]|nr:hypothetical protein [bacterium]